MVWFILAAAYYAIGFGGTTWVLSALGYKGVLPPLRERIRRIQGSAWSWVALLAIVAPPFMVYVLIVWSAETITLKFKNRNG